MRIIPRRNIAHYRGQLRDIIRLMHSGGLQRGPYIKQFEEKFADYIGTAYAAAVSSGRMGLFLILDALMPEKGSEVMLPAYTDESVPETIRALGHEPVFIDVDRSDHNIDAGLIESKISHRTKAILATHIFGRPCNVKKITEIAQKHGLFVIEDCAHAIGAEYNGQRVGSFGAAAYFSFGITKPFNTFGGGMITTNDAALQARLKEKLSRFDFPSHGAIMQKALVSYGLFVLTLPPFFLLVVFPWLLFLSFFNRDLIHIYNTTVKPAAKSRISGTQFTNIQALMGIRHLSTIDVENDCRRRNAGLLMSLTEGRINTLKDREALRSTYYFFVVLTRDASVLAKKLLRKGIDTGKYIMRDCSVVDGKQSSCMIASEAVRVSLQIPNYPRLTKADMVYIATTLADEA